MTTDRDTLAAIIQNVLGDNIPRWDADTCAREIIAAGWAPTTDAGLRERIEAMADEGERLGQLLGWRDLRAALERKS